MDRKEAIARLERAIEEDFAKLSTRRLKVRRADLDLADLVDRALAEPDAVKTAVSHGGEVANAYGYRAATEVIGVAAIADAAGNIRCYAAAGRIPANKVTLSGAAAATLGGGARAAYDKRCGESRTREALAHVAKKLQILQRHCDG